MKKLFISAAASVLSVALLASLPSFADECGCGCQDGCRQDCAPRYPSNSAHIKEFFNLSEEQQSKAKPIAESYEKQFKMSVQEECKADLESLLTAEQKAKLQEMQIGRMEEHRIQFENLKKELKAVLTPEQQAKLEDFRPVGPAYPVGLDGVNITIVTCTCNPRHPGCCEPKIDGWMAERLGLTEEQTAEFKAVEDKYERYRSEQEYNMYKSLTDYRASARKDIERFLNAEQRAKLEEIYKNSPQCGKPEKAEPRKR